MTKLFIDTHEDNQDITKVKEVAIKEGFEPEVGEFEVSDYYIGNVLGIEHKKPADFISSMTSHRLFQQATELKENFTIPVIMVDGELQKMAYAQVFSNVNPGSILAAVDSLYVNYGVPVYFVGKGNLAHRVVGLAKKVTDGGSTSSYIPIRPNASHSDYQIHVLCAFPGIGRKKAENILKEYSTLSKAFDSIDEWPAKVGGIGPTITNKIKNILGENDASA